MYITKEKSKLKSILRGSIRKMNSDSNEKIQGHCRINSILVSRVFWVDFSEEVVFYYQAEVQQRPVFEE